VNDILQLRNKRDTTSGTGFARLYTYLLAATVFLSLGSAGNSALPDSVDGEPMPSLAPLVKRVAPAVVNIRVSQTVDSPSAYGDEMFRRFFGIPEGDGSNPEREVASAGSGVIVDAKNGYILTNHHVVENADKIQVSLFNEDSLDAKISRRFAHR